jgi:hypothetical protein
MADPRVHLNVRLNSAGVEWLDRLSREDNARREVQVREDFCTRSDVFRAALAVARKHEAEVVAVLKERL